MNKNKTKSNILLETIIPVIFIIIGSITSILFCEHKLKDLNEWCKKEHQEIQTQIIEITKNDITENCKQVNECLTQYTTALDYMKKSW